MSEILVPLDPSSLQRLLYFVEERQRIYLRKEAGLPREEWTNDPHLAEGHFCNIYRENDRVSKWIVSNWRTPHSEDPDLWFAMVIARLVNHTDTMDALGYPVPWDSSRFLATIESEQRRTGKAVFGSAYRVVGSCPTGVRRVDWLVRDVLGPMWDRREELRPRPGDTLESYHDRITTNEGIGRFLGAQVIADLKYVAPLRSATDWMEWCAPGDGSIQGRNRARGLPPRPAGNLKDWLPSIREIQGHLNALMDQLGWDRLHAQDVQNCLCEFDKYERACNFERKVRRKYQPYNQPPRIREEDTMNVIMVTAGTGTGKSSTMRALLERLRERFGEPKKLQRIESGSLFGDVPVGPILGYYFDEPKVAILGTYERQNGGGGLDATPMPMKEMIETLVPSDTRWIVGEGFRESTCFGSLGEWYTHSGKFDRVIVATLKASEETVIQRVLGRKAEWGDKNPDRDPAVRIRSSRKQVESAVQKYIQAGAEVLELDTEVLGIEERAATILNEILPSS